MQHYAQHPLSGKTVFFRFGGKDGVGPSCSARVVDWLDRLPREVEGLDSLHAEQMYLMRREANHIADDGEMVVALCDNEDGKPALIVFHQTEIITYEGHPEYDAILAEAE